MDVASRRPWVGRGERLVQDVRHGDDVEQVVVEREAHPPAILSARVVAKHLRNEAARKVEPALPAEDGPLDLLQRRSARHLLPEAPRGRQQVEVRHLREAPLPPIERQPGVQQRAVERLPVVGAEGVEAVRDFLRRSSCADSSSKSSISNC
jgi:hypothetical protein